MFLAVFNLILYKSCKTSDLLAQHKARVIGETTSLGRLRVLSPSLSPTSEKQKWDRHFPLTFEGVSQLK